MTDPTFPPGAAGRLGLQFLVLSAVCFVVLGWIKGSSQFWLHESGGC